MIALIVCIGMGEGPSYVEQTCVVLIYIHLTVKLKAGNLGCP